MSFMELQVTPKGALYAIDCGRCGCTNYSHEWATDDHNERRDAMANGSLRCDECGHMVSGNDLAMAPASFTSCGQQYAARYSAPGYMDCTEWSFGRNKRALVREVRDMYGDE